MTSDNARTDMDAQVGMLPMAVTEERKAIMSSYFTLTLDRQVVEPEKMRAFAAVAVSLGLHPLAGELMIIEKRLYITIDGRRRLAMRQSDFAAIEPFVVTDPEKRKAMGATRPGDVLAGCKLWRKSTPIPSIQYGLVREAERWPSKDRQGRGRDGPYTIEGEQTKLGLTDEQVDKARAAHDPDGLFDVARHLEAKVRPVLTQPAMMAMKRAEARALSLLASVALPTYDAETGAIVSEEAGNGDIIDGEAREVPSEPTARAEAPPEPAVQAPPEAPLEPAEPVEEPEAEEGRYEEASEETHEERPISHEPAQSLHPSTRRPKEPAGGGLLNPPETVEALTRYAIEKLGFRNVASILSALKIKDMADIKDVPGAWGELAEYRDKLARGKESANAEGR